jgi:hypothetical protein
VASVLVVGCRWRMKRVDNLLSGSRPSSLEKLGQIRYKVGDRESRRN